MERKIALLCITKLKTHFRRKNSRKYINECKILIIFCMNFITKMYRFILFFLSKFPCMTILICDFKVHKFPLTFGLNLICNYTLQKFRRNTLRAAQGQVPFMSPWIFSRKYKQKLYFTSYQSILTEFTIQRWLQSKIFRWPEVVWRLNQQNNSENIDIRE